METSFELSIVAILNLYTVNWDIPLHEVKYSNSLAIISLILVGALTLFLPLFYWKKFSSLKQKSFRNKVGVGVESTKVDVESPSKSILAYPVIFFGRRIVFAASAIFLGEFLWAQLAIQLTILLVVAGY